MIGNHCMNCGREVEYTNSFCCEECEKEYLDYLEEENKEEVKKE